MFPRRECEAREDRRREHGQGNVASRTESGSEDDDRLHDRDQRVDQRRRSSGGACGFSGYRRECSHYERPVPGRDGAPWYSLLCPNAPKTRIASHSTFLIIYTWHGCAAIRDLELLLVMKWQLPWKARRSRVPRAPSFPIPAIF